MPNLRLALLGPPIIERDGAPLSLDRQKAVALLAYLALTGRRHGREALAALLWPDLTPERAYAALRQALWALNQALGEGLIASDRTGVALEPAATIELDVAAFRARLAAARTGPDPLAPLAAAAALYRGDLLEGLELRDSAPFAEWRFFEAEALRAELAGALDQLATVLAERGDHAAAAAAARRRLALDPLHEPAHRALMGL
jgi:DNA-binding SARP family transcriptional activator